MGSIKDGRTNFAEQTDKYKQAVSNNSVVGGGYDVGIPGIFGVSGEHKVSDSKGSIRQNNNFTNDRTTKMVETIEENRNW